MIPLSSSPPKRYRTASTRKALVSIVIIAVAALGTILLTNSLAATPYASQNAASGNIGGSACSVSSAQAASGHYVEFGSNCAPITAAAPVQICSNSSELSGPASAPAGAVTVPAGDNSSVNFSQSNTVYWFAPGTHTLGTGRYNKIIPGSNDVYEGGPGAILSGAGVNNAAFGGGGTNDTIEYLTIQDFAPPGQQGAVNANSNPNWTITHTTMQNILPGAAMMVGSNDIVTNNCITNNGQYAFNAYQSPKAATTSALTGGPQHITMSDNEISYNNTCNWNAVANFPITPPAGCSNQGEHSGCGCSGGGKFWRVDQATFTDNYVHNNYGAGLWADTNNTGFDIENNYFANNSNEAIIYEISYNALIKNNTFLNNAWALGPGSPSFPAAAVYISESGSDSRIPGPYGNGFLITDNTFTNNWSGVLLWENANRYCASSANTSGGVCTLVNPSVATLATCGNPADLATTPYINDCRWKTQNVTVSQNIFNLTPTAIGASCTPQSSCGMNGLFSEFGSFAPYKGWYVPQNISDNQHNVFSDNSYTGPWSFMGFNQGERVSWAQWTAGFVDTSGSHDTFTAQDAGSTYNPA